MRGFLVPALTVCFASALLAADVEHPNFNKLQSHKDEIQYYPDNSESLQPIKDGESITVIGRITTLTNAEAIVELTDLARIRINQLSAAQFTPPPSDAGPAILRLLKGSLFASGRTEKYHILAGTVDAVGGGTDYHVAKQGDSVLVEVFTGSVKVTEGGASTNMQAWQRATLTPGSPIHIESINTREVVEWCLRYPAILDPSEIRIPAGEREAVSKSLDAWQRGNLNLAIASFPATGIISSEGKLFQAAIELAAGQTAQAQLRLHGLQLPAAAGLRAVLNTVKRDPWTNSLVSTSGSAWLGQSWWLQANSPSNRIAAALAAVDRALASSPNSNKFGFAWARKAELEFSRGHLSAAHDALDRAMEAAPEFAPNHVLMGFLLASQSKYEKAVEQFDKALDLDRSLADAWLGRGMCLIRVGQREPGRVCIQNAVSSEPFRSILRSYLGKAWQNESDAKYARIELKFAAERDPNDPTPFLYLAWLDEREFRFNAAITNLQHSLDLSSNRAIYRSEYLLDQDRATRSANLAQIYNDAGLESVAVREASRAVAADFGSWSGHLFLARSFDSFRDPARLNLRYETPWFNELLLARMLAPGGVRVFSQSISELEYTRLFEVNRPALETLTEVRSDGRYRAVASYTETLGPTSWGLDVDWERREKRSVNDDLNRVELYPQLKQQIGERDSLLLFGKIYDYRAGDLRQLSNARAENPDLRTHVQQLPIAVGGWHREWSPESHTLLMGGRVDDDQRVDTSYYGLLEDGLGTARTNSLALNYRDRADIWFAEAAQIVKAWDQTIAFGVRGQQGSFDVQSRLTPTASNPTRPFFAASPFEDSRNDFDFSRGTVYLYDFWNVIPQLKLIGGIAFDALHTPANILAPPISAGSVSHSEIEPKAGVIWSPTESMTVRGAFAQSQGGASLDESFRLEPSQIGGFTQFYRSLLPESAGGGGFGQRFTIGGAAVDLHPNATTFFSIEADRLESCEQNSLGSLFLGFTGNYTAAVVREVRDYRESVLQVSWEQLYGADWSSSAGLRFTRSDLNVVRPDFPAGSGTAAFSAARADLEQAWARLQYQSDSGFYSRAEVQSFWQTVKGFGLENGDSPTFLNLFVGVRFPKMGSRLSRAYPEGRGDFSVGILDLNGAVPRLSPLSPLNELPRARTFVARLKIAF